LFSLILATFSSNQWDISRTRNSATALIPLVGAEADVGGVSEDLDASFVERALAQSPNSQLLDQLESESQARLACPQSPWLDATWHNISAEVARLQGRSATALSRFDAASHQWAAMELDGRTGWLQARVSAACAAYEAMKLADSERTLGTVATEVEDLTYDTVFAMVPLLRGMIAIQRDARALAAKDLEIACERFRGLGDLRGEGFTRTALAECHIHDGDLARTALAEDARRVFGRLGDTRGRTYAELVLGDAALLGSRVDEARAIYLEAIRLSEYGGDKLARGTAYHKLANLETHVRRHDVALTLERKALEIERAIGHDTLAEQTERAIAEIELLAASTPPDT
jgi:tetratricopeptide (TPR) repeat protein